METRHWSEVTGRANSRLIYVMTPGKRFTQVSVPKLWYSKDLVPMLTTSQGLYRILQLLGGPKPDENASLAGIMRIITSLQTLCSYSCPESIITERNQPIDCQMVLK